MEQPQSGQGRPKFARELILWILATIVNITLGIIGNYLSTFSGSSIVLVVLILVVASSLAALLKRSTVPLKIPFKRPTPFKLPTIRIGIWPRLSSSEILTIAGTVVMVALVAGEFIVYADTSKYVSSGNEKDLARNYCASLQKQDYHRIYSYFKDGTDGLTLGGQLIANENTFVSLAHAAEKNGKVNDCHYLSATAQKNSHTCEFVDANEASGEACYQKYNMTLFVRRGGASYTTSMLITITTGSYGEYGHISVIDKL